MRYVEGFAYGMKEGIVLSARIVMTVGYILSVALVIAFRVTAGVVNLGARVIESR